MLNRKIIPKTNPESRIIFPEHEIYTTENNIKVFFVRDESYPLITFRFLFNAGSYNDFFENKKYGLANLTAELINKGAGNYDAADISDILDLNGTLISNGAGYDASSFSFTTLKENLNHIWFIIEQIINSPTFAEKEFLIKREQILNNLVSLKDDNSWLAEQIFKRAVYNSNPYESDADGSQSGLLHLNNSDIKNFYNKYYNRKNLLIAVVGDFDKEDVIKKLNNINPPENVDYKNVYDFSDINKRNVLLMDKPDSMQTSLIIGHKGFKRNHPDFIKANFMNLILGGTFTSRINMNLREKNGLTYGARTSFNSKVYAGDFSIETEVNDDKTGFAIEEILKELKELQMQPPTDDEMYTAKNYIYGNYPLQFETSNSIAGKLLNLEIYGIEKNYYNTYLDKIRDIKSEEVLEMANKYIDIDNITIATVGNSSKLKNELSNFGNIEIIEEIV